jgi:hypothetical protein
MILDSDSLLVNMKFRPNTVLPVGHRRSDCHMAGSGPNPKRELV